jgi:hypothetical protein
MYNRSKKTVKIEDAQPAQSSVIQLRVHGIGGATPDGLLGLPPGSEVVRVAGDEAAGVYARPEEPHVEGYVWSKLTRSAWAQALWIVLLPFTLFNVANWMYPRRRGTVMVASRALMLVLGISLTVSYLLWEMALIQQVFYQWQLGGGVAAASEWSWVRALLPAGLESPQGLGYVLCILALFLVNGGMYLLARRSRRDFEDVTSPVAVRKEVPEPSPAALGFPILDPPERDELRSGHFWARTRQGNRLLWLHVAVEVAFLVVFAVQAFPRVEGGVEGLGLGPMFRWVTQAQVVLILAVLVLYLAAFAGRGPKDQRGFRFAGPPMVATLAVALTIGAFTGAAQFIGARTGLPPAAELDLSPAFGAASLVYLAAVALWALAHLWLRRWEPPRMLEEGLVLNTAEPGDEPNGLSPRLMKRVALYRSFARSIPRLDLVFTATALAFLVSVGLVVFFDGVRFPAWLGTFGGWLVAGFFTVLLPLLIYRSFKVSARAKVGIIWDVLTFWPRRFHPFAVRPYAERAVPELERRIFRHIQAGRRVVVCAHSQGSVLAYAALLELAQHFPEKTRSVALVTFGSPLRTLYARFFPGYFRRRDFLWLREHLAKGDRRHWVPWRNFYRRTDYVGQALFTEELADWDVLIPDPPTDLPYGPVDPGAPIRVPPDPPQRAWTRPLTHSYYNNARELRAWVDGALPAALRPRKRRAATRRKATASQDAAMSTPRQAPPPEPPPPPTTPSP